jgi:para-aminobenzoate synthetase/4-amino-4-deoxychorismate lyase
VTPPADGRILPGVTRARLLAAPHLETREEPIPLTVLERAEAIVLTSSIRLATAAGLSRPPAPAARELAARLRKEPAISMKTRSYIR